MTDEWLLTPIAGVGLTRTTCEVAAADRLEVSGSSTTSTVSRKKEATR
jgi:hypothetical protein